MISRYEIISASVSSIYHDIQKIQRTEMAKYGLKGPHAQFLLAMSRYPEGITAARLCEICEKDKAAISRTLTELEQAGQGFDGAQRETFYHVLGLIADHLHTICKEGLQPEEKEKL